MLPNVSSVKFQWGLMLSRLLVIVSKQSCRGILVKRETISKLTRTNSSGDWKHLIYPQTILSKTSTAANKIKKKNYSHKLSSNTWVVTSNRLFLNKFCIAYRGNWFIYLTDADTNLTQIENTTHAYWQKAKMWAIYRHERISINASSTKLFMILYWRNLH